MKQFVFGLLGALALGVAASQAIAAPAPEPMSAPIGAQVQTIQYRDDGFREPRYDRSRGYHRSSRHRRPHYSRGYHRGYHGSLRRY